MKLFTLNYTNLLFLIFATNVVFSYQISFYQIQANASKILSLMENHILQKYLWDIFRIPFFYFFRAYYRLSISKNIFLHFCLSTYLCVCLSVCLFISYLYVSLSRSIEEYLVLWGFVFLCLFYGSVCRCSIFAYFFFNFYPLYMFLEPYIRFLCKDPVSEKPGHTWSYPRSVTSMFSS